MIDLTPAIRAGLAPELGMTMRRWMKLGCAVTLVVAAAVAADKQDNSAVVGVWRGELDNLPAATLNVTDEAGPLQGAMLFYLIRKDNGRPATSSLGVPEPLFNPHFDGKSLTFQLSHRHAHGNTASDPPVTFRLDLTGPDEAKLVRVPVDGPAYMPMVRDKNWK
jgi:hypothetical protein